MKSKKESIQLNYVTPYFNSSIGGAEVSLKRLFKGIRTSNHIKAKILTSNTTLHGAFISKDVNTANIIKVGLPIKSYISRHTEWKSLLATKIAHKLEDLVTKNKLDVIYLNRGFFFNFSESANKINSLKKPIILKGIHMKGLEEIIEQKAQLPKNIILHVLSSEMYKKAIEAGFKKKQIFFCPNPLDTKEFRLKTKKDRSFFKKYGVKDTDLVVTFTGRLAEQKNLPIILKIFADLEKLRKDVKFFIIGSPSEPKMISIVKKYKQEFKFVTWIDKVPNKQITKYLWASDCFILASKDEGLSNSLLEAMSCGVCPIVPQNVSGMKDVVTSNKNGFLYDLHNTRSLVKQLGTLKKEKINEMGKKARNKIVEYCSTERIIAKHLKLYKALVK